MATAGVTEAEVLRPAGKTRTPAITPTREVQLYSIAGARPKASLEPELRRMLGGICMLVGSKTLYPAT